MTVFLWEAKMWTQGQMLTERHGRGRQRRGDNYTARNTRDCGRLAVAGERPGSEPPSLPPEGTSPAGGGLIPDFQPPEPAENALPWYTREDNANTLCGKVPRTEPPGPVRKTVHIPSADTGRVDNFLPDQSISLKGEKRQFL